MNILHVADLHLDDPWFDWVASQCSEFDLLVIAGDLQNVFSNTPVRAQARAISQWLTALRSPTIVCSGNHDYWVTDPRASIDPDGEAGWLRHLKGKGNVVAVDGDTVDFGGERILVNGWLERFK